MAQPPAGPGPRLFVGNLSWGTTDESLRMAFTEPDMVPSDAKVIFDRQSGRSRGFGFVTFDTTEMATMAKEKMNEQMVDGRPLRVDFAQSTQQRN